jgi:hypothetical protein
LEVDVFDFYGSSLEVDLGRVSGKIERKMIVNYHGKIDWSKVT